MRHCDASPASQELRLSPHDEYDSNTWRCGSPTRQQVGVSASAATHAYSSRSDIAVKGCARVATYRSGGTLPTSLQRICAKANTFLAERWFLRWGLYAVRRAALRCVEHRALVVLWRRVGARCFSWWRLVTERRMCREMLHREAAVRERVTLIGGLCRVSWDKWRRWTRTRARQRAGTSRLALVNRQRHAHLRFHTWACYPRRCRQLRAVEQIRFSAERSLARLALIRWRLHTLEGYLAFPLQVQAAQRVATVAFHAWQRRALVGARLRFIHQEALLHLAQSCFERWKRWLRRRLQAALLRKANETRVLLRIFSQWAWQHQLRVLEYEQYVAVRHLPRLFS
ncbi:hypothetical protein GH5_02089 [Leishmania sp. Ghana 2012 LV757]|uniref:hypothetical protein n=1 Tax=Leishmania sp. Ghana 2012 LV757 TaxID=2803181 RepID=UPI001B724162|nr:hypothetical protein GH5_02089 [Leishmania sp. Ghana 2012 LV757]